MTIFILQLYVPTITPNGEPKIDYKESNRASVVLSFNSNTTIRKRVQPVLAFQAQIGPKKLLTVH